MVIHEDDLPQRQQLPRRLRNSTRNLRALRACCPINGTPLNGAPTPLSPERRRRNRLRKEQKARAKALLARARASEDGREGDASGSGGKRWKWKERSSPSDGGCSIPPFAHSPTPGPQGKYHMWSIHDPLSPAVQIDQHQPAERRHTVPNHPSYSLLTPAGARDHCAMTALPTPVHTQSPAEWPESQSMSATPPSADSASRPHSALSAECATGWCTDSFIAAYQSYFISYSLDSRRSDHQALAPELRGHHPATPHQTISEPASRGHSTFIRDTDGVSTTNHTDYQRPRDMDLDLGASYVAQSHGGGEPIARSGLPAVIARIDFEPSYNAEGAANDGYTQRLGVDAQSQLPGLPATIYSDMHPVPPRLSMYSELAHDRVIRPSVLIGDRMFFSTGGATPRPTTTTVPAIAETPFHPHRSGDVLDSHSAGPVYLAVPNPPQGGNNENGFAHILEGCFDNVGPLSADIGLPLLEADFAEEQGPLDTAMSECARTALEGIARSDRLLSKMDSLLLSLGAASWQGRHDTATNGF